MNYRNFSKVNISQFIFLYNVNTPSAACFTGDARFGNYFANEPDYSIYSVRWFQNVCCKSINFSNTAFVMYALFDILWIWMFIRFKFEHLSSIEWVQLSRDDPDQNDVWTFYYPPRVSPTHFILYFINNLSYYLVECCTDIGRIKKKRFMMYFSMTLTAAFFLIIVMTKKKK